MMSNPHHYSSLWMDQGSLLSPLRGHARKLNKAVVYLQGDGSAINRSLRDRREVSDYHLSITDCMCILFCILNHPQIKGLLHGF